MRRAVVACALLAGCLAPAPAVVEAPALAGFAAPVTAAAECGSFGTSKCFEPTVAVGPDGAVYAATGKGDVLVVTRDRGATFDALDPPPHPEGAPDGAAPGDVVVEFDDEGRLWWSALYYDADRPLGQAGAGLQVARSDDGGATWTQDAYLSLGRDVVGHAPIPDRPWLASGGGDVVYATYWEVGVALWAARSDDAGATFGPFVPVFTTPERRSIYPAGKPVVADDRLVVPYFAETDPQRSIAAREVRVSVSDDGGRTFAPRTVHAFADDAAGAGSWPALAVDGGRVLAAWTDLDGGLWTAWSDDRADTWEAPMRWVDDAVPRPPAILPRAGGYAVAWFAGEARTPSVYFGDATAVGFRGTRLAEGVADGGRGTDFAAAAVGPDGRAVVAWADDAEGLRLAFER